jgi:hypothetical protein
MRPCAALRRGPRRLLKRRHHGTPPFRLQNSNIRRCYVLTLFQSRPFGVALLIGGVDEYGPGLHVLALHICSILTILQSLPFGGIDRARLRSAGGTPIRPVPLPSSMRRPSALAPKEHSLTCRRTITRHSFTATHEWNGSLAPNSCSL